MHFATYIKSVFLFAALMVGGISSTVSADESESLAQRFANPPDTTKPRCYWYWFDDQVSKEGITRDLQAMRDVGIGGAFIGVLGGVNQKRPNLTPPPLSEAWWELLEFAVKEGSRLGVEIGVFNCPGWSQSGGPWIKPETSMRYLVTEEQRIVGPKSFIGKAPIPSGKRGKHFQSVALLAYPEPEGDAEVVPITEKQGKIVKFSSASPVKVRSLVVTPIQVLKVQAELMASDDGVHFRSVRKFTIARTTLKHGLGPESLAPVAITLPDVTARHFQLNFTPDGMPFAAESSLGEIRLSPAARIEDYAGKSLLKALETPVPPFESNVWPPASQPTLATTGVDPRRVLDLTGKLQADGTLKWNVPQGKWILQHVGMAPTGTVNKPGAPTLTGPEVDKLNRKHLDALFTAYAGTLMRRLKPEERKSWKYLIADSYETGLQNWTDGMRGDFQRAYGYDPAPFFPAIGGRVVGSADESDRFLWDLRRLVADRVAQDYVGGLRDLCHANGLKLWLENYGHFGFPSEFLLYGAHSDEVSGEFWLGRNRNLVEVRAASSASRIYDKSPVWAEAFTSRDVAFRHAPRDLKIHGDWAFCQGINQFVLHVYIHQPDESRPGVNAWFGTEFNRHNTWFYESKSWINYLRRCSVMLQSGHAVTDFAVFITEDAPKMTGPVAVPSGHDYDFINSDAILHRLVVRNGRLVLPGGTEYAALILPDSATMRPSVAKKLRELADTGAILIGSHPSRSPSLQGFPTCDQETRRYANWKSLPNPAALGLQPDVIAPSDWLWTHRRTKEVELYFISNPSDKPRTETVTFRVTGRAASVWNPINAEIQPVLHQEKNGRSSITLQLPPKGSAFVVFGPVPSQATSTWPETTLSSDITGAWNVTFPSRQMDFQTLVSWTSRPEEDVRFHSGKAIYQKVIQIPADSLRRRTKLDLGRVESLATVTLNGICYPTLWTEPYQIDVSNAVKPGENTLQIEVVNTWHNRLVGDTITPDQTRMRTIHVNPFKADDPLQPAGLLGPVRLITGN